MALGKGARLTLFAAITGENCEQLIPDIQTIGRREPPMPNVVKFINEVFEGFIFYIYQHAQAIYVVVRFPIRGPRALAFKNIRDPARAISAYVFVLVNLIVAFGFMQFASPLVFAFDSPSLVSAALMSEMKRLQQSDVDVIPLIVRGLLVLVPLDIALRLAISAFISRQRVRRFVRTSCCSPWVSSRWLLCLRSS